MRKKFEMERYSLSEVDSVHLVDQRCGNNRRCDVDVWIESDPLGKRFLRQSTIQGEKFPVSYGIYSQECYVLQEPATGRYYFLEMAARGFFLQSDCFYGAEFYLGDEATRIREWLLAEESKPRLSAVEIGNGIR
jgi:hypothetical protein